MNPDLFKPIPGGTAAIDAIMLSATVVEGLFTQFLKINGRAGKVRAVWGSEDPQVSAQLAKTLSDLATAQLGPNDAALAILGERLGFQLQRITPPAGAPPQPFSRMLSLASSSPELIEAAIQQIASGGAAGTAREFRRTYAPLRRLIADSKSPEEVIAGVRDFTAGWPAHATSDLILEALTAFAANGAVITDR